MISRARLSLEVEENSVAGCGNLVRQTLWVSVIRTRPNTTNYQTLLNGTYLSCLSTGLFGSRNRVMIYISNMKKRNSRIPSSEMSFRTSISSPLLSTMGNNEELYFSSF